MTTLDWVLVGVVGVTALGGMRRGLVGTVLALVGFAAGAVIGARVAPYFLGEPTNSQYAALVALAGAVAGAVLLQAAASLLGSLTRTGFRLLPPLRTLDSLGGVVAGALCGVVLIWIAGAVALQVPGHPKVRREVERSHVLRHLDKIAPPADILRVKLRVAGLSDSLL